MQALNIKKMPKISIIIPTYNRKNYLRIAIESAIKQTYVDFELIIVDNCSTDGTENTVNEFNDKRIRYIRHPCNIQVIANWIYGMSLAQGEYFSILGDDDIYMENFLSDRIEAFRLYPKITAAFSDHDECDEFGTISPSKRSHQYSEITELRGPDLLETLFYKKGIWQIGSGLYKTHPVRQWWIDGIHSGKAFDTGVSVQIALKSSAAFIPENSFIYRYHANQDSKTSKAIQVPIGYFFAFFEPLVFEEKSNSEFELKDGATWALRDILKRSSGNSKIRRQVFMLHLKIDWKKAALYKIYFIDPHYSKIIYMARKVSSKIKSILNILNSRQIQEQPKNHK